MLLSTEGGASPYNRRSKVCNGNAPGVFQRTGGERAPSARRRTLPLVAGSESKEGSSDAGRAPGGPVRVTIERPAVVGIAQLGRASDCGSECRGFESHYPPQTS